MNELKRFENDLRGSEELRKKLDETAARIKNEGRVQSDGELLVAAAKELGYDFSIAALEKSKAEAEPLDPADFERVAGGSMGGLLPNDCMFIWDQKYRDENDHNGWCMTAWHCLAATLHTDTDNHDVACWSNYQCMAISKD